MKKFNNYGDLTVILVLFLTGMSSCHQTGRNNNQTESDKLIPERMTEIKATLGEGSIWDYRRQVLYWVDIQKNLLYVYDPVTGENIPHDVHQNIGTIVPETAHSVIVALRDGVYRLNLESDTLQFMGRPSSLKPDERFNDGKCDPQGRFWVGTMSLSGKKGGSFLYRMGPDGTFTEMIDSVSISNGIIWSPEGNTMYYVDTPTGQVLAFDFDGATGDISDPRIAVTVPDSLGHPDGMTIDAEGKLWVALWGGHAVGCFDPQSGQLVKKIEVPAKNVTSCAFGGKDLDVLFITTATTGMSEAERKEWPKAGALFSCKPGVSGIRANYFMPADQQTENSE